MLAGYESIMRITCGPLDSVSGFPMFPRDDWNGERSAPGTTTVEILDDAWNLPDDERAVCGASSYGDKAVGKTSVTLTAEETRAIENGPREVSTTDPETYNLALYYYYGRCGQFQMGLEEDPQAEWAKTSADDIAQIEAALILCPEHPEREAVEKLMEDAAADIAAGEEAEAEKEAAEKAAAKKKAKAKAARQAEIDAMTVEPGTYLVGDDVKPGTYVAKSSSEFENCYWEVSSKSGNIINNEWAIEGKSMVAIIPKSAYTFKNSGCGNFIRQ